MKIDLKNKFLNQGKYFLFYACLVLYGGAAAAQINIVAAENFYGHVAKALGGEDVEVFSILENPQQDPHLYSATPSIGRAIADADIVIYNGLSYDPWMENLLSIPASKPRQIIRVADLVQAKKGDNPHIWYDPDIMTVYAQVLATHLIKIDPKHADKYRQRLQVFLQEQQQLQAYVGQLKLKVQGRAIAATEPLFNLLAAKLNLPMLDKSFQLQVMNEGTPAASSIQNLINDLQQGKIAALIYNRQVTSPMTENIKQIAKQNNVGIVGMSETLPAGLTYQAWMREQLEQLDKVLTHEP